MAPTESVILNGRQLPLHIFLPGHLEPAIALNSNAPWQHQGLNYHMSAANDEGNSSESSTWSPTKRPTCWRTRRPRGPRTGRPLRVRRGCAAGAGGRALAPAQCLARRRDRRPARPCMRPRSGAAAAGMPAHAAAPPPRALSLQHRYSVVRLPLSEGGHPLSSEVGVTDKVCCHNLLNLGVCGLTP